MYQLRMKSYYPPVISAITEFKAIIDAEYPEFEALKQAQDDALNDAYLLTMGETRIAQWERALNIVPLEDSTVEDRRNVIIARIRGQGKLNTKLIQSIVNAFTSGSAEVELKNSVIYVTITPPPDNRSYRFADVENELAHKIPLHLGLKVSRNYFEWGELLGKGETWGTVKTNYDTWEDILLYVPFEV